MVSPARPVLQSKLWLYTNLDCNLRCSYCVTKSTPEASRRLLSPAKVRRLVDEAEDLGFDDLFFTGGEPFLLDEIYRMLAYASARLRTTVLTNGMLLKGRRLERLQALANDNLKVQVSLDGSCPEEHNAYRGRGTWAITVAAIKRLLDHGLRVSISTTETPANSRRVEEIQAFRRGLGIADEDHLVRPLAKRGFSQQGADVKRENLQPELTVMADGVYWHPLTFPGDEEMWVRDEVFPLAEAVEQVGRELECGGKHSPWTEFA